MSRLLSVEAARAVMLDGVGPSRTERVETAGAVGRVLAEAVVARRDQPPFDASAMDGWAVRSVAVEHDLAALRIVGESAAGRPFSGAVLEGEAVRIFTGAPVPGGCRWVVPQEVAARDGAVVRMGPLAGSPRHIRLRAGDFAAGDVLIGPGVRLDPWRLALAASAGADTVAVAGQPEISFVATGEEIVQLGAGLPDDGQIYDSASYALQARARQWGGRSLGITLAGDRADAIERAVVATTAELIVFIGGASVGDYDLVKPTLQQGFGLELSVESVNVRPGKPTWFGRLEDGRRVLGLPGNPASALVCAELFLGPLLLAWQGAAPGPALSVAGLARALPANSAREHWMRAIVHTDEAGAATVTSFPDQDSSLVTVFAQANALLRRPAAAPAATMGEPVRVLLLDRL